MLSHGTPWVTEYIQAQLGDLKQSNPFWLSKYYQAAFFFKQTGPVSTFSLLHLIVKQILPVLPDFIGFKALHINYGTPLNGEKSNTVHKLVVLCRRAFTEASARSGQFYSCWRNQSDRTDRCILSQCSIDKHNKKTQNDNKIRKDG